MEERRETVSSIARTVLARFACSARHGRSLKQRCTLVLDRFLQRNIATSITAPTALVPRAQRAAVYATVPAAAAVMNTSSPAAVDAPAARA
jgi:hypothetical protein